MLKGNGTAISAATAGTDYQIPISLTTIGNNSASTFNTSTGALNIPNYTLAGLGGIATSGATVGASSQSQVFTNGATLSNITSGSVLFAGASGVISQDNSNLFYDATNHRLGIGTTGPSFPLDVTGNIEHPQHLFWEIIVLATECTLRMTAPLRV